MPILFGWGHQTVKDLGQSEKNECSNCQHTTFWNLYVVKTWFTLFFLPVIPYCVKRYIACPVCDNSIEISEDDFEAYNNIALINQAYNEDRLSSDEYEQLLNDYGKVSK